MRNNIKSILLPVFDLTGKRWFKAITCVACVFDGVIGLVLYKSWIDVVIGFGFLLSAIIFFAMWNPFNFDEKS